MHLSNTYHPTTTSLHKFIILLHERVQLKTLADKPTSLLPLLGTVNNKFKLSRLFWSVFFQLQVPPTHLFLVCVFKYFALTVTRSENSLLQSLLDM